MRDQSRRDPEPERLAPGVFRFRDPRTKHRALAPFPAYVQGWLGQVARPPVGYPSVEFSSRGGRALVRVEVEPGTSLYATGEQPGPLRRNGTVRRVCTTDSWCYDESFPALYQAHPWVMAVRPDGSSFGVIAETTRFHTIDLRRGIEFVMDHGDDAPAATVIDGADPASVVRRLAALTGQMPLPPKWALGFHQSRWSYEPASRVLDVARTFRERWHPCDVIWLDIDYMQDFKVFTFDREKFPDPAGLCRAMREMGFRTVWMIDPGIKAEAGYRVYDELRDGGHGVRDARGEEYQGRVWPGPTALPDFTRHDTRRWWAGLYADFLSHGPDGIWNDMNEPAVFDTVRKRIPDDCRHDADPELGGPGTHSQYRNIYGMQMVRASREGMRAARPDHRPFLLTRANFLGGHRYAATWTGDNVADWTHLAWSIPMALNLSLSGQPMCGPDIGGFFGEASPELYARWMGIGCLLPFARCHKIKGSADHEPWSFGEACEHAVRLALERRYRLMPYLYTLAHRAATAGDPIIRPLFFADPSDRRLRGVEDAFLLGPDVMVRCRVTESGECAAPMPRGAWRRFELTEPHAALPELWLREGAVLPVGPIMKFVDERPLDPLTLYCHFDRADEARGELYEDAGDGYGYERGESCVSRLLVRHGRCEIRTEGTWSPPPRQVEVVRV